MFDNLYSICMRKSGRSYIYEATLPRFLKPVMFVNCFLSLDHLVENPYDLPNSIFV